MGILCIQRGFELGEFLALSALDGRGLYKGPSPEWTIFANGAKQEGGEKRDKQAAECRSRRASRANALLRSGAPTGGGAYL